MNPMSDIKFMPFLLDLEYISHWMIKGGVMGQRPANLLDSFTIELRWGLHLLALDHFPAGVNIQESLETWRREV